MRYLDSAIFLYNPDPMHNPSNWFPPLPNCIANTERTLERRGQPVSSSGVQCFPEQSHRHEGRPPAEKRDLTEEWNVPITPVTESEK